jgi:hypothetical protein
LSDSAVDLVADKLNAAYQEFITEQGIQDSRLARIGFYQVVREVVEATPGTDQPTSDGVLAFLDNTLDADENGLKDAVLAALSHN